MIKLLFTIVLLSSLLVSKEEVIGKVGNEKITFKMLENAYGKNLINGQRNLRELSKDSIMNFVNLYVDYRLKVLDAIDKGYLEDSVVKEELETNKRLLAESYYFENELMKPKINEIVNRRKVEYKFAFIIIPFQNAEDSEKQRAKAAASTALNEIKNGMDFQEAAKKYSEDPATSKNGGVVESYVTGGSLQKELEDIFFTLEPGEFHPEVIQTSYGYFVVKLLDRRDRKMYNMSQMQISLLANDPDSLSKKKTIDSLKTALDNGADFSELAANFSDDPTTKANKGYFGRLYSRSTGLEGSGTPIYKAMEEVLSDLNEGDYSDVLQTNAGYHIIKVNEILPIDEEKEYEKAKEIYKKIFYTKDKEIFMDSVAKSHGFSINSKNLDKFQSEIDTNKTTIGESWPKDVSTETKNLTLFNFNDKTYTIGEFINLCISRKDLRGFALKDSGIEKACKKIIDKELFDLATEGLESKYPEYKRLINEFRDGIILFKAEDEEVWSKRKYDDKIGKAYWDTTKSQYRTNRRYDINEIYRMNKNSAEEIKTELDNGADFLLIAETRTQREGFREKKGYHGWVEVSKNDIADLIPIEDGIKGKIIGPIKNGIGWSIIKINDVEAPRMMTYEEAKLVISPKVQDIVQENLRKNWLSEVRKRHSVEIYESKIEEIIN